MKVLLFSDWEAGHAISLARLGAKLVANGHQCAVIGPEDAQGYFNSQQLSFSAVFPEAYPAGTCELHRRLRFGLGQAIFGFAGHYSKIVDPSADFLRLASESSPDIVVCCTQSVAEALLLRAYLDVPVVILYCAALAVPADLFSFVGSEGLERSVLMGAIAGYLDGIGVEVSDDLALRREANRLYSLSAVDPIFWQGQEPPPFMQQAEPMLPTMLETEPTIPQTIYCSLGSNSFDFPQQSYALYSEILKVADELKDWEFWLSVPKVFQEILSMRELLPSDHPNVSVMSWYDQPSALKKASLAILHGGMGGLQDAIVAGTPFVTVPLGRDQTHNAVVMQQQGCGLHLSSLYWQTETIVSTVLELSARTEEFESKIGDMKIRWREYEKRNLAVKALEHVASTA